MPPKIPQPSVDTQANGSSLCFQRISREISGSGEERQRRQIDSEVGFLRKRSQDWVGPERASGRTASGSQGQESFCWR